MKKIIFIVFISLILTTFSFQHLEAADLETQSETQIEKTRSNWYVSVGGGINYRKDSYDEPAHLSYKTGYIVTGAIGGRLENLNNKFLQNFRVEIEYARRFNKTDKIELRTVRDGPLSGNSEDARGKVDIESYQAVINYDFPLRKFTSVKKESFLYHLSPYIGVGLGFNRVIVKDLGSATLDMFVPSGHFDLDYKTDYVFCWSPRIGVTYEITKHFEIFIDGRYHESKKVTVVGLDGLLNHPNLETWSGGVGIRYNF